MVVGHLTNQFFGNVQRLPYVPYFSIKYCIGVSYSETETMGDSVAMNCLEQGKQRGAGSRQCRVLGAACVNGGSRCRPRPHAMRGRLKAPDNPTAEKLERPESLYGGFRVMVG